MDYLLDPNVWASFLTLAMLEIVLGIDNVIFVSIAASKARPELRQRARVIGLTGALVMRVALLTALTWIIGLSEPLWTFGDFVVSWRDIILGAGGLFLLVKSTLEIHSDVQGLVNRDSRTGEIRVVISAFAVVIVQIMVLDLVFSLDSIITAIGMTDMLPVMIAAIVVAIILMMVASGPLSAFIERHPTTKMLALAFLLIVGVALIADALHFHIPRGYLYFAIAFSTLVEGLNLWSHNDSSDETEPGPQSEPGS